MTTKKIEKRSAELRAAQGEEFVLVGRALSYNEISSNELFTGCREQIMPGCFADSLAANDEIYALFNHQAYGGTLPLGRRNAGTLQIVDSPTALNIRVLLDKNNSQHRDLYSAVKRGDLSEMSFGMVVLDDLVVGGNYTGQPCQIRQVIKAQLTDCSVVLRPFYGDGATTVQSRGKEAAEWEALKARAAALPADWERTDKAHELALQMVAAGPTEQRGNQDWFADRCAECCDEAGLDYCSHTNDHIFASPKDSDNEEDCCRFAYTVDENGRPILDEDSRTQVKHKISHSLRQAKRARREDAELRDRMWAASGISTR
jgi:uncharacterized protein